MPSLDLTNRLPYMRLSNDTFDSYGKAVKPQINTKKYRGEIYLREVMVDNYSGFNIYKIVLEGQTLEYLNSDLLKRDVDYTVEYGWVGMKENPNKSYIVEKEITVYDVEVNLSFDWGGVEIILKAYDRDINDIHTIECGHDVIKKSINSSLDKNGVKVSKLMNTIKSISGTEETGANLSNYTFDLENDFVITDKQDIVKLKGEQNGGSGRGFSFLKILREVLYTHGKKLIMQYNEKNNKGEMKVIDVLLVDDSDIYEVYRWGSDESKILSLNFGFSINEPTKVNTVELVTVDSVGSIKKVNHITKDEDTGVEGDTSSRNTHYIPGTYIPGFPSDTLLKIENKEVKIPPRVRGEIDILGDPLIKYRDNIQIENIGALSGTYSVIKLTNKINDSGYMTTMELISGKLDAFTEAV